MVCEKSTRKIKLTHQHGTVKHKQKRAKEEGETRTNCIWHGLLTWGVVGVPQLRTIGQICNRCTSFVAMTT